MKSSLVFVMVAVLVMVSSAGRAVTYLSEDFQSYTTPVEITGGPGPAWTLVSSGPSAGNRFYVNSTNLLGSKAIDGASLTGSYGTGVWRNMIVYKSFTPSGQPGIYKLKFRTYVRRAGTNRGTASCVFGLGKLDVPYITWRYSTGDGWSLSGSSVGGMNESFNDANLCDRAVDATITIDQVKKLYWGTLSSATRTLVTRVYLYTGVSDVNSLYLKEEHWSTGSYQSGMCIDNINLTDGAGETAPAVQTYVVDPPVTDYHIFPGETLPSVCKSISTMSISACKGEYEPASFVVKTNVILEDVEIQVSNLTGTAGTIPSGNVDVRAVNLFHMPIGYSQNGQSIGAPDYAPVLLLHQPGLIYAENDGSGNWSNVVRTPVKDAATMQPINIKDLKQYWLTVRVPDDASAGTYTGTVTITSANASSVQLTLALTVRPFSLSPSKFVYSVFNPAYLGSWSYSGPPVWAGNGTTLNATQYRLEMDNMKAHGHNPNIYEPIGTLPGGNPDTSELISVINIREAAGIGPGVPLYLVGHQINFSESTPSGLAAITTRVASIVSWAQSRGYPEVYFYAQDEQMGDALLAERPAMGAVRQGGGKVFVGCWIDYYDLVGDLLDMPVLSADGLARSIDGALYTMGTHLGLRSIPQIRASATLDHFFNFSENGMTYPYCIEGTHSRGYKILGYSLPSRSGTPFPELFRRIQGLGLWRTGYDGTMNWAYTHIIGSETSQRMEFACVYRGTEGVIDTRNWEAAREAVDDTRYLATLQDMIAAIEALGGGGNALVVEAKSWLVGLNVDTCDLNAFRDGVSSRMATLAVAKNTLETSGSLRSTVTLLNFSGDKTLAPVEITITLNGSTVRTEKLFLDANNQCTITNVPQGAYDVAFVACGWLRNIAHGVVVPGNQGAGTCGVSLSNGDANGDGEVSTTDLSTVLSNLNMNGQ